MANDCPKASAAVSTTAIPAADMVDANDDISPADGDVLNGKGGATATTTTTTASGADPSSSTSFAGGGGSSSSDEKKSKLRAWLQSRTEFIRTRFFWYALVLGQILALCITSTNTFSSLLSAQGTSIPAFQTLFNYVLLFVVYTPYTIYRLGWREWGRNVMLRDGWRYILLSFLDVEGNYFTVLGYRYATILSLQLINFCAILSVVVLSTFLLRVRYHTAQYAGIIICIGGMGLLLASDHITGSSSSAASNQLKGDLFALLGALIYGATNVYEEWFVSKQPVYLVLSQMGLWGTVINGTQAAIFDRASFATATWNAAVAGYLTGYTLVLFLFYSLAPLVFRIASAAFMNISLLTGNFWGVVIGIRVFHYTIHWMYPIAFVLILFGLCVYFLSESVLGEAKKPWLGERQEEGVDGVGTAKRMVEHPEALV
ncbi:hypothetical protein JOL62DRAFT_574270 [Phyllosticta paracitricarpa]|uniref:Solute carrier family 35 member n=1 Tax=Phyllosticta paracitricarpa TaxID=2016321 RepID=A0ABR1N776_9PEZI